MNFSLGSHTCTGLSGQYYKIESKNHRIVGAGTDLWRSSSPAPMLKQVHLEQLAQDYVQEGFECLQRRLHSIYGQPVQVLCHTQSEEVFPHIQRKPSVFQFVPIASCPVAGDH